MSKKLTEAQIQAQAIGLGIEVAALKAVIEVECKGSGFNVDGTPVILFERHVFRQRLIANGKAATADKAMRERPDLCNKTMGNYGLYSAQHGRLSAAAQYHRESALESASWGIGQVMGYHWKALGYPTLQNFINAMYLQNYFSSSYRHPSGQEECPGFLKGRNLYTISRQNSSDSA